MKRPVIMLVDDDESIREAFAEVLEEDGFTVRGYRNGREAIEALHHSDAPNLILLDWMMPVMSGSEFIRSPSAIVAAKSSPVVVISAVADQVGDVPGVRACVNKPIDIELLLHTVREFCAFPPGSGAPGETGQIAGADPHAVLI